MSTAWLEIATEPEQSFFKGTTPPSDATDIAYGALLSTGDLRRSLSGEISNVSVELDNSTGNLTSIFADLDQLQRPATIWRIDSDDNAVSLFDGVVTAVRLSETITVTITP